MEWIYLWADITNIHSKLMLNSTANTFHDDFKIKFKCLHCPRFYSNFLTTTNAEYIVLLWADIPTTFIYIHSTKIMWEKIKLPGRKLENADSIKRKYASFTLYICGMLFNELHQATYLNEMGLSFMYRKWKGRWFFFHSCNEYWK